MKILKAFILIIIIFTSSMSIRAQKDSILPNSIYSFQTRYSMFMTNIHAEKGLEFKKFRFRTIDMEDIRSDLFTISFENINRASTLFDMDSYQKIIFNETKRYYDPNKIALLPTWKNR